jgi:hypothetical protein
MITTGGFSLDIREDAAGRYYVYERDGALYRLSMSYPTMEALYEAITADIGTPSIQWLPWQPVR